MRSWVWFVAMSLSLILLNSGCGGKSDEKKPEQTGSQPVQVKGGVKGRPAPPTPPPPPDFPPKK
jgi:hypothetical protein